MESPSFFNSVVSLANQAEFLTKLSGETRKLGRCERIIRVLFGWLPYFSSSTSKCLRISFLLLRTQLETDAKSIPEPIRKQLLSFNIFIITPSHPLWRVKNLIEQCCCLALGHAHREDATLIKELKEKEAQQEKQLIILRDAESNATRADQDKKKLQIEVDTLTRNLNIQKLQFQAIISGLNLRFKKADLYPGSVILHRINAQRAAQTATAIGPRVHSGITVMDQCARLRKDLEAKNAELAKAQKELADMKRALEEARAVKPITFHTGGVGSPKTPTPSTPKAAQGVLFKSTATSPTPPKS